MKAGYVAAGLALMLAGVSSAALAAPATTPPTYVMKFTGTVSSGVDSQDIFGGGNLAGDKFLEVFDVISADVTTTTTGVQANGTTTGGRKPTNNDPISLASLTIYTKSGPQTFSLSPTTATLFNGKTRSASSATGSVSLVSTPTKGSLTDSQSDTIGGDTYTLAGGVYDNTSGAAFPKTLNKNWNIATGGGVYSSSGSQFLITEPCGTVDEDLKLAVTSATPEPATWALMFTGVGLLGATLRRRRSPALATA